jgi:hypothetical protein
MSGTEAKNERTRLLQIAAESKRLARMRTLEVVAAGRIASLEDRDPQRAALQRQMRAASSTLRAAERDHEARR